MMLIAQLIIHTCSVLSFLDWQKERKASQLICFVYLLLIGLFVGVLGGKGGAL